MLVSNEAAMKALEEGLGELEASTSSHWVKMLEGYEYSHSSQTFRGRGLPEGEGAPSQSLVHELAHRLFQLPYHRMGSRYPAFRSLLGAARKIHKNRGNQLRVGTLRQVVALAFIDHELEMAALTEPTVIIGDGFGLMGCLALSHKHLTTKIVLVNLRQNLLADAFYIRKSLPDEGLVLAETPEDYQNALDQDECRVVLVRADNAELISHRGIGLAINIAAMQEMDPEITRSYFSGMRRSRNDSTFFYCANREKKTLPDGTVSRFADYGWCDDDEVLVDGLCPWMQKYYSPRPPFYHPYDGPHRHRLVKLSKE